MCNCNKYHLSGVPKGSINLRDALNNGYLIAALVAMGFNFKDSADWAQTQQDILNALGRSAQMVYGAQTRAIAENIDVLSAQFQVMNQALNLNETNPYILTAAQIKKSFIDASLNVNNAGQRDIWLRSYVPQNLPYIDMERTKLILDSMPIQMSQAPNVNKPISDQRPGPAGHEVAQNTNPPMTTGAKVLWGLVAVAGGVLLYNALSNDKPKSKSLKGGVRKSNASKPKVVQTLTL